MGKTYFPETTASATIVNAPWVFAKIYSFVSPLLTPVRDDIMHTRMWVDVVIVSQSLRPPIGS